MDAVEQVYTENAMNEFVFHLISEDSIRERAYDIYERRGRQDGRAEEDWLEAETQLRHEASGQQQSWT